MLQACTTPNQAGRLIFQRGATDIPQTVRWLGFDGQIAVQPPFDQPTIEQHIKGLLDTQLAPKAVSPLRALKVQSLILGCKSKPSPSCGLRAVVEVVGNDRQTILRAMEGIAELNLARPADTQTVRRALPALVQAALHAAVQANDQRPPPVSRMERLIRQGSTQEIQPWIRGLEDQDTPEIRRINLWIALGHVANHKHLDRLKSLQPKSDREAQVRNRALRWISAASADAGKSSPAHVTSPPAKDGDRP